MAEILAINQVVLLLQIVFGGIEHFLALRVALDWKVTHRCWLANRVDNFLEFVLHARAAQLDYTFVFFLVVVRLGLF